MDKVAQSFFSLVRTNNGFFKSEKQAGFLLSRCENGTYYFSDSLHGNGYLFTFFCDETGVVRIEKDLKNGTSIWWERMADHDEFLRLARANDERKRKLKALQKRFARIHNIVSAKNSESTKRTLKMIQGKSGDGLAKAGNAMMSIENKIKRLSAYGDELMKEIEEIMTNKR